MIRLQTDRFIQQTPGSEGRAESGTLIGDVNYAHRSKQPILVFMHYYQAMTSLIYVTRID